MKGPPSNRVSFLGVGDELNYLNDKISYWWHVRHNRNRALAFLSRFQQLLATIAKEDVSIAFQGHFALLHEVKGDLSNAILHLRRQITSTKQAIKFGVELGGGLVVPRNWPATLGYPKYPVDYQFLTQLLFHLAELLHQHEELSLARKAVKEAITLSKEHGFNITTPTPDWFTLPA